MRRLGRRSRSSGITSLAIALALAAGAGIVLKPSGRSLEGRAQVTDGDTIRVTVDGRTEPVRLILIDTPETHDPNDPPECFGQQATAFA